MILSFKEQFVEKILNGTKIHTIREDKNNRWKSGMKIHFWKGNPRNVKNDSYHFAIGVVSKVVPIEIHWSKDKRGLQWIDIDGKTQRWSKDLHELKEFVQNDGFDSIKDFLAWFNDDFEGKLIYFEKVDVIL